MSGILWGLLAAFLIGASDCIARVTSARVTASVLISVIMGASVLALAIWLAITGDWPHWHFQAWFLSMLSGTLTVVVLVLLYKALQRGPVSVASPSASVFAVLLVGLNALAGEPWTVLQLIAVVIVFGGVVMLARRNEAVDSGTHYDARWLQVTAAYGLAAAFAIAFRMFLAQEASVILGPVQSLFLNRLFALLAGVLWILWQWRDRIQLNWPKGRTSWLVALQAATETTAFSAFLYGSVHGGRVETTIGFSAFVATTTIIARIWLGEKIGWYRGFWIAVIGGGVWLASQSSAG